MSKREDIEGALKPFYRDVPHHGQSGWMYDNPELSIDALAESKDVIVIECKVEHYYQEVVNPDALIFGTIDDAPPDAWIKVPKTRVGRYYLDGHHGTPGKATCIVLPRKE